MKTPEEEALLLKACLIQASRAILYAFKWTFRKLHRPMFVATPPLQNSPNLHESDRCRRWGQGWGVDYGINNDEPQTSLCRCSFSGDQLWRCSSYQSFSCSTVCLRRHSAAAHNKARFPLPELTAQVNGPSWRVTGFHYPSTRAVLTGARFH